MATMLLMGCKKDNEVKPTINKFFSVENATLVHKNMPEATTDERVTVSMNNNVIPGGSSIATVQTDGVAKKLLIGMKDQDGYYEVSPTTRGDYSFIMMINQDITLEEGQNGFTVLVAVEDENGGISPVWETSVSLIVVGTGTLQVSLSFDNEKDVDLHLIEPEYTYEGVEASFYSRHIYYGNKTALFSGGELDLDSNPGCSIDGINNENITYSEECFVPAGTYKLYVDLFQNCDSETATNYVVTVSYGGRLIANKAGVFEKGAPSTYNPINSEFVEENDPFLTFTITGGGRNSTKMYEVAPMTQSAIEKETIAAHN